ncbi:MAG TPA: methyltransferase domain-containing protein [Anaeromyxobacteraceae bacterium]
MKNAVDKRKVRRAFSRGAAEYDAHALVQRRAVDRLLVLTLPRAGTPGHVLDVGAGTGTLLERLAAAFPGAAISGVDLAPGMARAARDRASRALLSVGDAEALPFRSGCFDLVLSTSTLQWLPHLEPALAEAHRVVAPGGTVAVALFGGATLHELRGAWREALPAGAADRTHRFRTEREVGAALVEAGLAVEVLATERVVERHAHPVALLKALKRIGAGNASPDRGGAPGLGARGALARMSAIYEARHGGADGVLATWEIVYAVARRPGVGTPDEAKPPPSSASTST